MSVLIRKPGILSTVQDLGRTGYRRFGINTSGPMDRTAVRLINILLGNDENSAVIEMHFPAAEIVFEQPAIFAVGGAEFSAELNKTTIKNWSIYEARKDDVLSFRQKTLGHRVYFAVRGGFLVERWLGSASTNLMAGMGGFHGRRLSPGDTIPFCDVNDSDPRRVGIGLARSLLYTNSRAPNICIMPGPEYDVLSNKGKNKLTRENFGVSPNSNRMGFRLTSAPLDRVSHKELLSSGVIFGTVQLLPDGQLIVLMADHQTTGGYPRIATVTSTDLPLLAQLGPGDELRFDLINANDAEKRVLKFESELGFLRTGLRARISGRL